MECGGRAKRRHRFGFFRDSPRAGTTGSSKAVWRFASHRTPKGSSSSRLLDNVLNHLVLADRNGPHGAGGLRFLDLNLSGRRTVQKIF